MYDPKASKLKRLATLLRLAKRRSQEGNLPLPHQIVEMARLWLTNGVTPPHYFAAGLYRPELSWADKCEFLGPKRYYALLDRVNDKRYEYVAYNKLVTGSILNAFNVPSPTLYGFVSETCGQTFDGHALQTCADLDALLRRIGEDVICFKLVDGWGGRGFYRVSLALDRDPILVRPEPAGSPVTLLEFWERDLTANSGLGYLCQAAVKQHSGARVFNPCSVNTTRVWLQQVRPATWELFSAVFRMGTGDKPVDNPQAGGLTAPVDIETGRLGAAFNETVDRPTFAVHPKTGVPIEGGVVPNWDQVVQLCSHVGIAFPYLRVIGIDIAIGVDGPLVLEIEARPDDDQIGFDRGVKTLFQNLLRRSLANAAEPGQSAKDSARGVIATHAVDTAAGRR